MMKILVAGGTGFLGRSIVRALLDAGHSVVVLSRRPESARYALPPAAVVAHWDGATPHGWGHHVDGADAILNFAGASIGGGRWTARRKEKILNSRLDAGRAITEAIRRATVKPAVLISASGVGYYGNVPEGEVAEGWPPGGDFLAEVCIRWEAAAAEAGVLKASLEPAPGALGELGAGDLLDQGPSRPAAFGGPGDDVVESRSGGMQSDLGELPREVTGRGRRRDRRE